MTDTAHISIVDCTLHGSEQTFHTLFVIAEADDDSWCGDCALPYHSDITDALIGIFGSADDWCIGALASGLIMPGSHVRADYLRSIYHEVAVIADRTIDRKHLAIASANNF